MRYSALIIKASLGLMLAAPALASNEIIRSIDRDGRVVYSDRVPSDSRIVERIAIERPSAEDARRTAERASQMAQAARAFEARYAKQLKLRHGAERDLLEAERWLAATEQQIVFAETPLPGETRGIRRGGVRLTDEYFIRQYQMRADLAQAHAAVTDARMRLNAVR